MLGRYKYIKLLQFTKNIQRRVLEGRTRLTGQMLSTAEGVRLFRLWLSGQPRTRDKGQETKTLKLKITSSLENVADLLSIQTLLRHANILTTQVYTHVTDKHLREIHKAFHGKREPAH